MKLAITGASGMLGTALICELSSQHQIFATSRTKGFDKKNVIWNCFDLLNFEKLEQWLYTVRADVIIHCAALTNVDFCEKNPKIAKMLHTQTTEIIADYCQRVDSKPIYISTDSVFDGIQDTRYSEGDNINPLNVYANTKFLGEAFILATDRGLVLRTNIVGWSMSERLSFAEWILKGLLQKTTLTLFNDVYFSTIHVTYLARIIEGIFQKDVVGLYHLTGNDKLSKYEFGLKVAKVFNLKSDHVVSVSIDEINLGAKRPKNMALSNKSIMQELSFDLPSVEQSIHLMKEQYDNGYLSKIKGRRMQENYHFWDMV